MNPVNLLRKYESEMTALRKFATKFPGYGNLSKLPSAEWYGAAAADSPSGGCKALGGTEPRPR